MTPVPDSSAVRGAEAEIDGSWIDGRSGRDGRDGAVRILVVDDCRLRRECLSSFLTYALAEGGCAWDMESLDAEFDRCQPDLIVVNITTHGAEQLLQRSIEKLGSPSRVIVVGLSESDKATIVSCVEAGVGGYHLRSESLGDLLDYIRKVSRGESACSPLVSSIVLRRVSELASRPAATESLLTAREDEVLQMLAMGLSNRAIAERLCIAVHTVKNHVHNLLTKLQAKSRAEAVALYRDSPKYSGSYRDQIAV